MASYDRNIIRTHADRLYRTANLIILLCGLMFAGGGLALGAAAGLGLAGAAVGALLGVLIGMTLSFNLKLKAQTALCQLRVEENTAQLVAIYTGLASAQQVRVQLQQPHAAPLGR